MTEPRTRGSEWHGDDDRSGPGGGRLLSLGGLGVSLASAVLGALGVAYLPGRMRIHWSFGYPYVGPEFAPTLPSLAALTTVTAAFGLAAWWLAARGATEEVARGLDVAALVTLVTAGGFLAVQAVLVLANL